MYKNDLESIEKEIEEAYYNEPVDHHHSLIQEIRNLRELLSDARESYDCTHKKAARTPPR